MMAEFKLLNSKGRAIIFGGAAQTIFFQLQAHKSFFFSGNGFANIFFSPRNAMLYYEEFHATTLVLPLTE